MNQIRLFALLSVLFASWAFAPSTQGQEFIKVKASGFEFAAPTAWDASVEAVYYYHQNALEIALSAPPGYHLHAIDIPTITVFPNMDGTFDGLAEGFVWFRNDILLPPRGPDIDDDIDWQ